MLATIGNECISLCVDTVGAEMMELVGCGGMQYLWYGDPAYWRNRAINLFPYVGRLQDNRYCYGGKPYSMNIHGFAHSSDFEIAEKTRDHIKLQLQENAATLAVYPFSFVFCVEYRLEGNTVLIDYSHTPDSLENILKTVRGFCKGRVIAVFGCGGDRDPIKRPIMGRIGAELSDVVVVTSDNPRTEDPMKIIDQIMVGVKEYDTPCTVIENRRQAIRWAMDHAQAGDVIVLAGKGHETYQEIGHEKFHLDEREEVAAHLLGN